MRWKRIALGVVLMCTAVPAAQKPVPLDEVVKTLPRFTVSGTIVDANNQPIVGAKVCLYYAYSEGGVRDRIAGTCESDAQGRFVFDQAVVWEPQTILSDRFKSHYSVIARHPDFGMYFANLYEGDSLEGIRLSLTARHSRVVTVKNKDGEPVPGASVFMCSGQLTSEDREGKDRKYTNIRVFYDLGFGSATTDAQGKADVACLVEGAYLVSAPGYKKCWVPGDKAILFPGAAVSGIVRYPDGTPASNAAVMYTYHGNRLVWDDVTVADANGCYQFDHVAANGFYYSWMNPDDEAGAVGSAALKAIDMRVGSKLLSKKEGFEIKPGEHLNKDLTFADSVSISGRVIDIATGEPAPHMGLRLLTSIPGQQYLDTKTVDVDENGEFTVSVAPGSQVQFDWEESRAQGQYLMDQAWREQGNYSPKFRQAVNEDVAGLEFQVKLVPLHPMTGRVVNATGQGVKGTVYIHSDLPPIKTDDTGAFTIKGAFAKQDFDLYAESSDRALAGIQHVETGVTDTVITLAPTKDYSGRVASEDGMPARDLKFYLDLKINDSTVYRVRQEPKTDDKGWFKITKVCPVARYYAWWSSDNEDNRDYDYGNADIDLSKLAEGDVIQFHAKIYLNVIMGTVVDEQGEPVVGANVRVESYDLIQQDERSNRIVTDETGSFEVPRLAAGTASLCFTAQGYVTKRFSVPTDTFDFEAVLSKDTGGRVYKIKVTDDGKPVSVPWKLTTYSRSKSEPSKSFSDSSFFETNDQGEGHLGLRLDVENYVYDRILAECDVEGYDLVWLGFQANEEVEMEIGLKKSDGNWWSIQVQDLSGHPLPEATAKVETVQFEGKPQAAFFRDKTEFNHQYIFKADEQGRIQLKRFNVKDSLNVAVSAPGFAKVSHWLTSRQPDNVTVQLSRAGRMTGTVVNKEGTLPQGLRVYGRQDNGNQTLGPEPVSGDGTFKFENCVPGQYVLRLLTGESTDLGALVLPNVTAEVREGQSTPVAFELKNGTLVSGKVVNKETGEVPKDWNLIYVSVSETNNFSRVDEHGSWKFYLPEGNYMISYRAQNQMHPFKTVDVTKGEPIENLVIEVNLEDN